MNALDRLSPREQEEAIRIAEQRLQRGEVMTGVHRALKGEDPVPAESMDTEAGRIGLESDDWPPLPSAPTITNIELGIIIALLITLVIEHG